MNRHGTLNRLMVALPYAIGFFMLVPYMAWILLWWLVFPGPKNGFDDPVGLILLGVTAPLAGWFFLRSLGDISGSMAADDRRSRGIAGLPIRLVPLLPYASLVLAAAGAGYLAFTGAPWHGIALVVVIGIAAAAAIFCGESRRLFTQLTFLGGRVPATGPAAGKEAAAVSDADDDAAANRWLVRFAAALAALLLLALMGDALLVLHVSVLVLTGLAFVLIVLLLPSAL